eukprot:scaffold256361_cov31-Tisochrysis_lutea.AAC.4
MRAPSPRPADRRHCRPSPHRTRQRAPLLAAARARAWRLGRLAFRARAVLRSAASFRAARRTGRASCRPTRTPHPSRALPQSASGRLRRIPRAQSPATAPASASDERARRCTAPAPPRTTGPAVLSARSSSAKQVHLARRELDQRVVVWRTERPARCTAAADVAILARLRVACCTRALAEQYQLQRQAALHATSPSGCLSLRSLSLLVELANEPPRRLCQGVNGPLLYTHPARQRARLAHKRGIRLTLSYGCPEETVCREIHTASRKGSEAEEQAEGGASGSGTNRASQTTSTRTLIRTVQRRRERRARVLWRRRRHRPRAAEKEGGRGLTKIAISMETHS